jgi:hypothetical protein
MEKKERSALVLGVVRIVIITASDSYWLNFALDPRED